MTDASNDKSEHGEVVDGSTLPNPDTASGGAPDGPADDIETDAAGEAEPDPDLARD